MVHSHALHTYYLEQLQGLAERRATKLAALSSGGADLDSYIAHARAAVVAAFPLPADRCPLNAVVTRTLPDRGGGYTIECVHFDSRPGVPVTANLYLPLAAATQKVPAVLFSCGHSASGKGEDKYQQACGRLAAAGFAVLIYDPICQGERDQYADTLPPGHGLRGSCVQAHNMLGKQMELLGDFFGAWRLYDGIRALDYLLSRPEIDDTRVGMTGNSGGGTMTSWLWAIEPRFTMAAPSCFITTFERNFENELPADSEQYPPGVLGAGLEMADLLLATNFPKPLLLCGQRYCFFDRRGLAEAHAELEAVYALRGAAQDVGLFVGENNHGFHEDAQTAVAAFFCQHAGLPAPDAARALPKALPAEAMLVCAGGQVLGAVPAPAPRPALSPPPPPRMPSGVFARSIPYAKYLRKFFAWAADDVQSRGRCPALCPSRRCSSGRRSGWRPPALPWTPPRCQACLPGCCGCRS